MPSDRVGADDAVLEEGKQPAKSGGLRYCNAAKRDELGKASSLDEPIRRGPLCKPTVNFKILLCIGFEYAHSQMIGCLQEHSKSCQAYTKHYHSCQ